MYTDLVYQLIDLDKLIKNKLEYYLEEISLRSEVKEDTMALYIEIHCKQKKTPSILRIEISEDGMYLVQSKYRTTHVKQSEIISYLKGFLDNFHLFYMDFYSYYGAFSEF